jgi:tetratricopeptide (TPR) repeat protein
LKRFEEALAAFERVTYLIPKDADAWNSKASVLYKLNCYYEAIEAYAQAIHLDARNPSYYFNMGKALKQLGRFKEAQQAIDKALRLGYDI